MWSLWHRSGLSWTRPVPASWARSPGSSRLAVALIVVIELLGHSLHLQQPRGDRRKALVAQGIGAGGADHRPDGEAGFQADVLRGGLHLGYWRWQYRIHKLPLVTVPQGKIGYVYARDGQPLPPSQTLGQVVACNNFQDARTFLVG